MIFFSLACLPENQDGGIIYLSHVQPMILSYDLAHISNGILQIRFRNVDIFMSHMLYDVILDVINDRQGHFRSNSTLSEKIEISCSRYRKVVP